jgi:hypothetical protein
VNEVSVSRCLASGKPINIQTWEPKELAISLIAFLVLASYLAGLITLISVSKPV